MKRQANPELSSPGQHALAQYEQTLHEQEDLTVASIRNYVSGVRHFIAWYEQREAEGAADGQTRSSFDPRAITTPTLTRYRTYLQTIQRQKPASVNRSLISLKRYFSWAIHHQGVRYDPSRAVKLVGQEPETAFLFPSGKTKDVLSERALGYIVKKYAKSAKLADVSPHDLRHRFGYRMAASVPLHRLAQIMGHDSLDTTKLYIQGTRHDLQQAVETIAWQQQGVHASREQIGG